MNYLASSTSNPPNHRAGRGALLGVVTILLTALAIADSGFAAAVLSSDRLLVSPEVDYASARLFVAAPDGTVYRRTVAGDTPIAFELVDEGGEPLADGRYRWAVRLTVEPARGERQGATVERLSGAFTIDGGTVSAVGQRDSETTPVGDPQEVVENHFGTDLGTAGDLCAGCSAGFESGANSGDERVTIIDGTPGIAFLTSEDGLQLDQAGWEIATDGFGGDLYISDLDSSGSSFFRPLRIDEGTPSDTITTSSSGRVGLGTSLPVANLHLAAGADIFFDGNSAQWSLETDGDFSLSLENGNVFDPPALTVENDNSPTPSGVAVGIFRANPQSALHVSSPRGDGSAQILVTEDSLTTARRQLLRLENNGSPEFVLSDESLDLTWELGSRGRGFKINRGGSGVTELFLRASGDLQIAGTLSQGSSRTLKKNFAPVDGREILRRVNALPLAEWTYKTADDGERHVGPMAEDFRSAFGLGSRDDRLAPSDAAGVALAAIQGLSSVVDERERELETLRAEVAELRELVARAGAM